MQTTTHLSLCKKLAPLLRSREAATRVEAGKALATVMDDHVGTSWLSMYAASAQELLTCTAADKDARARAAARGALRQLAFGLWYREAYAEALPALDAILRAAKSDEEARLCRWGCRLALGDSAGAAKDLAALRGRAGKRGKWRVSFVSDMHWAPFTEVVAVGLARAAVAHLAWARGKDPCTERRKPSRPAGEWSAEQHVTLARDLVAEAQALVEPSVQKHLRRRSSPSGGTHRPMSTKRSGDWRSTNGIPSGP